MDLVAWRLTKPSRGGQQGLLQWIGRSQKAQAELAEGTKTLGELLEYHGYRSLESVCEDQGTPFPADEPSHPIGSPIERHTEAEPEAEGEDEGFNPESEPGAEGEAEVVSPELAIAKAPIEIDDEEPAEPSSSSRRERSRTPMRTVHIPRPPLVQSLRPTWALLEDTVRSFVYNPKVGDFAEQRRTRRLTVGSHGCLFLDFHQVLDSRRSPIQGATLPVESSNTVDLLIQRASSGVHFPP